MRISNFMSGIWFAAAFGTHGQSISATVGHCKADEVSYFTCKIKNSVKVVSLCGSPDLVSAIGQGQPDAWLQYRFGELKKPEFVFPRKKAGSVPLFEGFWSQHNPISETDTWGIDRIVSFKAGRDEYSMMVVRYESEFYGVDINRNGRHTTLSCDGFSAEVFGTTGDSNSAFSDLARALKPDR